MTYELWMRDVDPDTGDSKETAIAKLECDERISKMIIHSLNYAESSENNPNREYFVIEK